MGTVRGWAWVLVLALAGALLGACGSGSSTRERLVEGGAVSVRIPLPSWASGVSLTAGEAAEIPSLLELPEPIAGVGSAALDFEATLPSIQVLRVDGLSTPEPTLEVSLRYAPGDAQDTVCDAGGEGPSVTLTGDSSFALRSADPPVVEAGDALLDVANAGPASGCLRVTSSVDAIVDVYEIVARLALRTRCDDAPADIAGDWSGSYTCTSSCGGDFGGTVLLTVFQASYTAISVDDAFAVYFGAVCGDGFRFSGGGEGYAEWGELTLTGRETARKTSTYVEDASGCSGDCVDQLTRDPG